MPRSMTGYGNNCANEDGLSVTVEIRSVNNRYLDFNFRLPRALYSHEHELREMVKKRIQRGRISIFTNVEYDDNYEPRITLDIARVRVYERELRKLQQELNLAGELNLDHLISSGDIFRSEEDDSYTERLWGITLRAFTSALDQYVESSATEAEALCADIILRIKVINEQLRIIETDAANQVGTYQKKLLNRLSELLDDNRIDRNRLETEIALAADKLDISEEIVRLDSHIQFFNAAISGKDAVGKKLGFVLQEMGREANTIASKSWSILISEAAIKIKELLEQIREQVQNLE